MIGLFIISFIKTNNVPYLTGFIGIVGTLYFFSLSASDDKRSSQYPSLLYKYKEDYNNYIVAKFEYPIQIKKYNLEFVKSQSTLTIKNYRINLIDKLLLDATKPFSLDENSESKKKGKSEDVFLKTLKKIFKRNIYNDLIIPIQNTDKSYSPDFIYWDKEINLLIDIELDEPYDLNTGTPIHYFGKDDRRNEFFLSNGWFIIRFSEEQIIKEPEYCCDFIEKFIDSVQNHFEFSNKIYSNTKITKRKIWTKEEAYKLAYQRIREHY
jgi:very-short-patch-repair endonuclease